MPKRKHAVIVQKWELPDGTPDGYSMHLTNDDRKVYIEKYWNSIPMDAHSKYSRPVGKPYFADSSGRGLVDICLTLGNGVRTGNNDYFRADGGWVNAGEKQ